MRHRRSLSPISLAIVVASASLIVGVGSAAAETVAKTTNRHGLGISGGVAGHSGFAYRYFIGPGVVQVNAIALMIDSGDFFAADLGLDYAYHLHVWQGSGRGMMPSSMALRAVAGASVLVFKDEADNGHMPEAPTRLDPNGSPIKLPPSPEADADPWQQMYSISLGFGFEFGSVTKPGFSLVVDVRPTYVVDERGFWGLVVLPFGAAMYNW